MFTNDAAAYGTHHLADRPTLAVNASSLPLGSLPASTTATAGGPLFHSAVPTVGNPGERAGVAGQSLCFWPLLANPFAAQQNMPWPYGQMAAIDAKLSALNQSLVVDGAWKSPAEAPVQQQQQQERAEDSCQCPICGHSIRPGTIGKHFEEESERLEKKFDSLKSALHETNAPETLAQDEDDEQEETCPGAYRRSTGRVLPNGISNNLDKMTAFHLCPPTSCDSEQASNEDDKDTGPSSASDCKWSPASSRHSGLDAVDEPLSTAP